MATIKKSPTTQAFRCIFNTYVTFNCVPISAAQGTHGAGMEHLQRCLFFHAAYRLQYAICSFSGGVTMYRKILITTDGSAVSKQTACAGVKFAQQMGAEVLALFVAPEYQYPVYVEIIPPSYPLEEEYIDTMQRTGEGHLSVIMQAAEECGLKHGAITAFANSAALKIVEVAEKQDCDLIFMGSHGRSGFGQLLLGSVTNKVLSHTLKPVLVHRLIREPGA